MAEKRQVKRKKKRLKLQFGLDSPERIAFTGNISSGGLFITTRRPERPGKYLLVHLLLPGDKQVVAYGQVRWAKKAPPGLSRIATKGGMGLRLTGFEFGEEDYRDLLIELG